MKRSTPTFLVRDAAPADLAACARLFAAGQQEIEPDAAEPWQPAAFTAAIRGELILVAVDGCEQVMAFLSLWCPDRFVHFLHVHRDRRGHGLARCLLMQARQRVDGPLELKCLPWNLAALACYRRLGWRVVERCHDAPAPFIRLRQPT